MTEAKNHAGRGANERILAAATTLFAQFGYYSVSTREIATAAQVNEVTIFRHYPRKHDLYVAVLKSRLEHVSLRGDLLSRIAEATDGRTALARTFELIEKTLSQQPELLRLLHYRALDLSEDFDPLIRTHLGTLVEVVAHYLEPWMKKGELRTRNTRTVVFAIVSIVVSYSPLQRMFQGESFSPSGMFDVCADIYNN
jgi:AcrR family transcriptional regulator